MGRTTSGSSPVLLVGVAVLLSLFAVAAGAQMIPDKFADELSALAMATHPRPGMHLEAIAGHPVFRNAAGEEVLGALQPGAEVVVVATARKRLRVRLDGWQQDPGSRAVYARRGLRVLSLALTPEAAQQLRLGASATDPATGIVWRAVRVEGWLDAGGLVAAHDRLSKVLTEMNNEACGSCHAPKPPPSHTAYQWAGGVSSSRHRTLMDAGQMGLLLHWLQMGASDKGF